MAEERKSKISDSICKKSDPCAVDRGCAIRNSVSVRDPQPGHKNVNNPATPSCTYHPIRLGGGEWSWCAWPGLDDQPPLVFLHGFTGSGRDAEGLAEAVCSGVRILSPDLPGHGGSSVIGAGMTAWVDAVGEWLKAVHGGGVHLVGYSMGGRIALRLAHRFPEEICRLTLLSTSPGISNEQERRARRQWDLEMAQQIRSKGMIHFADFWEALPILGWPRAVTRSTYCRAMGERRRLQTPEGIAMAMEWIGDLINIRR